ncbi:MAG TPA: hypothetical protein PKZ22_08970, partial [Accumulibacter sp.]|nr:hypothetical protein [Accumulibacter sp.]
WTPCCVSIRCPPKRVNSNPNAVAVVDERTPGEIIKSIEAQGDIVANALTRLKGLISFSGSQTD